MPRFIFDTVGMVEARRATSTCHGAERSAEVWEHHYVPQGSAGVQTCRGALNAYRELLSSGFIRLCFLEDWAVFEASPTFQEKAPPIATWRESSKLPSLAATVMRRPPAGAWESVILRDGDPSWKAGEGGRGRRIADS